MNNTVHSEAIQVVDENMTPEQAARLLNVKPGTLAVWRSTKRVPLPFFRIGGQVRYQRSEIERFIKDNSCHVA